MKKRLSFILVGVVGLGTLFFVNSASEEKNVEANYVSFGEIANQVYGSDANSLNKASINTLKIKEPLDLIINEQRFSASYLTKLHLLKGNATEDEAKEDAFKSLITEAAIFERNCATHSPSKSIFGGG